MMNARSLITVVLAALVAFSLEAAADGGDCSDLKYLCANFLVGETPPTPLRGGPCCKAARENKPELGCLCTALDFSTVSAGSLFRFNTFCGVRLSCGMFH
ncbi:hypothetical protein KP509_27G062300 [Ceratopteris richardii]|uniref:Bifunctional inhibitor/plant lipid transfer protein/seed storage helical domain-containing protein n=1 Tax=Ceratopteris richardii TaxID=49495 RepID=A0A8T2RJK2_CERRI|nr:hypothetical protein KP509_27G062300 [Ceratopteris richardii]